MSQPFMVIATQNPVDYEGTFPLPDSQMDRFLMRISMGYPGQADELEILKRGYLHYDHLETNAVISRTEVTELQSLVHEVFIEDTVYEYMLAIVDATRQHEAFRFGVSPRGTLSLKIATQARALSQGRSFVVPDDVKLLVGSVLGHRLALKRPILNSLEANASVETLLDELVAKISAPL